MTIITIIEKMKDFNMTIAGQTKPCLGLLLNICFTEYLSHSTGGQTVIGWFKGGLAWALCVMTTLVLNKFSNSKIKFEQTHKFMHNNNSYNNIHVEVFFAILYWSNDNRLMHRPRPTLLFLHQKVLSFYRNFYDKRA